MAILKVKNENGEYINIPSIKGEQGLRGEKGDKGDKGEAGKSGVHVGSEPPIDESVNIWLNPNGEASNYLATKEDIPTKTSQLINDNEYVTEMELNEAISNVGGGTGNISSDVVNSIMIVDELPEVEVEGVLYLVKEVIEEETKTTN